MKKITRDQFDTALKNLLITDELKPYIAQDILHNGLQTWGREEIGTVGFGVSASIKLFELAKKNNCDALVVHHGIVTQRPALCRIAFERYKWLIQNNISLWGGHFLLDAHPVLGHPANIIRALGGKIEEPYFSDDAPWGMIAQMPKNTGLNSIVKKLKPLLSPNTVIYDFGPTEIRRVVIATGMGAPYMDVLSKLAADGIDLFVTGEAHEWNREEFREAKVSMIAGGHYHTETFGVKALQAAVEKELKIKTVWLDLPNEI